MQGTLFDDGLSTYDGTRDELDRYYTPPKLTQALLQRLGLTSSQAAIQGDPTKIFRFWEPCAGRQGAIARVLKANGHRVITSDIDPGATVDVYEDATDIFFRNYDFGHIDGVITNPPFSVAADIIRNLLPQVDFVACLLRLSFLEPCDDRVDLLCERPPAEVYVTPRVKFRTSPGSSGDSVTTAWFVWRHPHQHEGRTQIISKQALERAHIRIHTKLSRQIREGVLI